MNYIGVYLYYEKYVNSLFCFISSNNNFKSVIINLKCITMNSISVGSLRSNSNLSVHGSILGSKGTTFTLTKDTKHKAKESTLTLKLDINGGSEGNLEPIPFHYIEMGEIASQYDKVEIQTNQEKHILIDVEEFQDDAEPAVFDTRKQRLSSVENKLAEIGSVAVMSKKGSKTKDR